MRKLSLTILFFAFLIVGMNIGGINSLIAQSIGEESSKKLAPKKGRDKPERPAFRVKTKIGVFGHLQAGVSWGFFGKLEENLKNKDVYTENWYQRSLATHYGGKILVQFGGVLLGGGISAYSFDASLATFSEKNGGEQGEAFQKSYYFTPTLGYAIINRAFYEYTYETNQYDFRYRWMLYPFVGLGLGGKNTMTLANYSSKPKYFGDQTSDAFVLVPRQETRDLTTNHMLLEIGLGTQFMKNNKGGLMLGAEIGGFFNIGAKKWNDVLTSKEVKGVNDASFKGIYIRATVGGGYFNNKEIVGKSKTGDGYVKPEELEAPKEEKPKKEKKRKKDDTNSQLP